ncbi:hypothetical protein [Coleofasciculus sp. FACHB-T130]|uniref:glycosyltransferase n=1 Tax=Cyanophyceae TaxID=3028117 RepID=UPI001685F6C4|nr:hypothetical protein [Coleofasciculus sp. FACHB-T130]MBD1879926.1 hypothetical protein [Coleofasciculus sp. FACHB-T130]
MSDKLPPIYFYLPQSDWVEDMPKSADTYWQGFGQGIYCWTLQTYLRLKADGFPCELIGTMPTEGIVLAHRRSFPFALQPQPKLLMVCFKADYERHPYAQLHVVQNPQEEFTFKESSYIAHWSQPGLIPRDPSRGDRFENAAYFGITHNLADELKKPLWQEHLKALGLSWHIVKPERWNDYSDVDVVVAVRSFDRQDYTWKPATKLINAWCAGVPAILGTDSAFRAERQSELDYLEVASLEDAIAALQRLRDDKQLRRAMMENGRVRAEKTQPARLVTQWSNFLTDVAVPAYERWYTASAWSRQTFLQRRSLAIKINSVQRRKNRLQEYLSPFMKSFISQL